MTRCEAFFSQNRSQPVVIAGPCVAESFYLLDEVASCLSSLSRELKFDLIFKSSFDKANRTSVNSYRGPGWEKVSHWFNDIREKYGVKILTDVHECSQVKEVAQVCDVLQIPAFLSRQTDLIAAAVRSGCAVNIKKGQFMSPENAINIANKVKFVCEEEGIGENFAITERGVSFGYGNLIVDMRSFPIISSSGAATIFDITHSLQHPSVTGNNIAESGGCRKFAPILARSATATGYLDGYFIETHPEPHKAKSDSSTQLPLKNLKEFLSQIVMLWEASKGLKTIDTRYD